MSAFEQYNGVGHRRVVLDQTNQNSKGPQYVPVITGNGFGTNFAFMGQGDGSAHFFRFQMFDVESGPRPLDLVAQCMRVFHTMIPQHHTLHACQ
jgi:hypothetical protein